LFLCLDYGLRLMHPLMPFVTEELWQRLPHTAETKATAPSIMIAPYPQEVNTKAMADPVAATAMTATNEVVHAVRSLAQSYGLMGKKDIKVYVTTSDAASHAALADPSTAQDISTLSKTNAEVRAPGVGVTEDGCATSVVSAEVTVHLLLKGLVKPEDEIARLGKQKKKAAGALAALEKKMSAYTDKVPQGVRDGDVKKKADFEQMLATLDASIAMFEKL